MGPKAFVPKEWRCKDNNAYEYMHNVPDDILERTKTNIRNGEEDDEAVDDL